MSIFKHIIALIILLILLALVYSFTKPSSIMPITPNVGDGNQIACTMDAMMCPDGSYVGRTGPNCEFVCPAPASSGTTSLYEEFIVGINQLKNIGDTTITVQAVTQDSRCPSDVVCVQAGKVVVTLNVATSSGATIMEIEPGKTVQTENLEFTLQKVEPYPVSTKKIADQEYRFVFEVRGR